MNKSSWSSWIYILCYNEISTLEWVNLVTLTLTSFAKISHGSIWHTLNNFIIVSKSWFFWTDMSVELLWCMVHAIAYLSVSFHMRNYYTNSTIIRMTPCTEFKHQGNNFAIDFETVRCISIRICLLLTLYTLRKFASLYVNDSVIYMATINPHPELQRLLLGYCHSDIHCQTKLHLLEL